ncbi:hypothetical protein GCM10011581_31920 [Saccharopolyspora subtropica]|uniref:Uncharacterized protein n=2 Tax=Saccharopolyspora thermophila TaxID=89367 RepID=A0A917JYG3_9PSEU|nr:hypothetical protein GCM10011581_31920 [Saccharopolyspora subtropica]
MATDAELAAQAVDTLCSIGSADATSGLAAQARAVQWALDEAAFELGGGRYSAEQRRQLAEQLVALASALRAGPDKVVIDVSE